MPFSVLETIQFVFDQQLLIVHGTGLVVHARESENSFAQGWEVKICPTQRVWPEIDLSGRSNVAHAVVLALLPKYRAQYGLFWGICCVEMWKFCVEMNITEIWMETPPGTLRLYRHIGWPLEIMGDLRMH